MYILAYLTRQMTLEFMELENFDICIPIPEDLIFVSCRHNFTTIFDPEDIFPFSNVERLIMGQNGDFDLSFVKDSDFRLANSQFCPYGDKTLVPPPPEPPFNIQSFDFETALFTNNPAFSNYLTYEGIDYMDTDIGMGVLNIGFVFYDSNNNILFQSSLTDWHALGNILQSSSSFVFKIPDNVAVDSILRVRFKDLSSQNTSRLYIVNYSVIPYITNYDSQGGIIHFNMPMPANGLYALEESFDNGETWNRMLWYCSADENLEIPNNAGYYVTDKLIGSSTLSSSNNSLSARVYQDSEYIRIVKDGIVVSQPMFYIPFK